MSTPRRVSRRVVLAAAAAATAGCSGPETEVVDVTPEDPQAQALPTGAPAKTTVLARVSDVPIGKPVKLMGPNSFALVVLRQSETAVVGFDAACTHLHCPVEPSGDKLQCPCHLSIFNAATGAAERGPATAPLRRLFVQIVGDQVVLLHG